MKDLDRHLDLASRQIRAAVATAPTPTFRRPAQASKVKAGLAAAAVTVAVILPVAGLLGSDQPLITETDVTQSVSVDADFETIVGDFSRADNLEGFSEPRDFVESASMTGFGMVAVGHHTELDSAPRAWIAPSGGPWAAIDLNSVDLTGVEMLMDVVEIDGRLALLALDILEFDGDPASRRLLVLESSDLASWTIDELSGIEAFDLGFTNVTGLTVADGYTLHDVARSGMAMFAIGSASDADAQSLVGSLDGGHTWAAIEAPTMVGLSGDALTSVAAISGTSVVVGAEERVSDPGSVEGVFQAVILWRSNGGSWEPATLDLSGLTESRITDIIAIDGGFLARGLVSDNVGTSTRALWTSDTGAEWQRVRIPELESQFGHLSYDGGTLTLFATPSLEPKTDATGAVEVWQGVIQVAD